MTTMIADPPKKATRLGVGLDANRRQHPNSDAWKTAIGTKPIAARLALLPESKPRWDRIGVSAAFQLSLLIFCVLIPLIYPDQLKTALNARMVELSSPVTEVPVAPPPPPPKAMKAKAPAPKPKEIEPVKLDPKKPHIFEIPKALVPKERKLEAVAPELKDHLEAAKIETATDQPKRPREDVKLNNISSGSAAPATVKAPIDKVQTGGFGDPNGMPGKGDPKHATTVNRVGSLDLPGGEGYGNGTGGAKGIRGTVASSGFGNGVANPAAGGGRQGKVESSGFGSQTVADAPKKKAGPEGPIDSPVDIIDKPKPEYTAEGRNLKLEGDVVLDVVFLSNGTMKVNRVISGLGHGLDEAAVRAAERIRFKPAKREGQPVDFPARVRIEFRLAY
jgi:TonB family protein